jgi:hypothetical protein
VLDAVLTRLRDAGDRAEVIVLYHTAVEQQTVEATQAFERVADLGFGLIYRRRP